MPGGKIKGWVFFGTRAYGYHFAVCRTLEEACRLVGVKPEQCRPWLSEWEPGKRYEYQILEEGDCEDYGE